MKDFPKFPYIFIILNLFGKQFSDQFVLTIQKLKMHKAISPKKNFCLIINTVWVNGKPFSID